MSRPTASQTAFRIAEHAHAHGLSHVGVVLHGGEPLLAGADFIAFLSQALRSHLHPSVKIDLQVQTNGTLIDDVMLKRLDDHGIRVGVSMDGDPVANDSHRRHPDGRGSHDEVLQGIERLRHRFRHLYAGLLCVIDPRNDPVATYEHLLSHEPPAIDFLLPHSNWSDRPRASGMVSYGDWLIAAFDRWYLGPGNETSVRLFEEIIRGLAGLPIRIESIGLSPVRHIVVETDGTIEQVDALKSAYEGAAHTGLHVNDDQFDAALLHPQVVARQLGTAALSETCRRCDVGKICGGGFFPHRYERGSGFRNPSVYCADLERLIRHVGARVREDLERCQPLVQT